MTPNCPKCNSSTVLRVARSGTRAGSQFYGCSRFPKCSGNVNIEQEVQREKKESLESPEYVDQHIIPNHVEWTDHVIRENWITEYLNIGSRPFIRFYNEESFSKSDERFLTQTVFIYRRFQIVQRKTDETNKSIFLASILQKILTRGSCPTATPRLEEAALNKVGIETDSLSDKIEWGRSLKRKYDSPNPGSLVGSNTFKKSFLPDPLLTDKSNNIFDSPREAKFYNQWFKDIVSEIKQDPRHWLIPQASLEGIATGLGDSSNFGARRVDFFFSHPLANPFVIELDGQEHSEALEIDGSRDRLLQDHGIDVYRVSNLEIDNGNGTVLTQIRERIIKTLSSKSSVDTDSEKIASLYWECSFGSKLQFAVLWAIQKGFLDPKGSWKLRILGGSNVSITAIHELCDLILSLDKIYLLDFAPLEVEIESGSEIVKLKKGEDDYVRTEKTYSTSYSSSFTICLERNSSPLEKISDVAESSDLIIRSTYLPFELTFSRPPQSKRIFSPLNNSHNIRLPLQNFLRTIFRKYDFREGQIDSITNILSGVSSVVLLPTGAGKSIIYQLSGLLSPGVTLVIDPLIALIDDQIEGMGRYGITKTIGIHSSILKRLNQDKLLSAIERGEYYFVLIAPERLQDPQFRGVLRGLGEVSIVNLTVIDEAHCVSEWGHDFRPSYLHLGRNLREFCKDKDGLPPPLLALTGTASRAVLRDLLADLEIDTTKNSQALIRPNSFDRKEISFDIRRTDPGSASNVLRGIIRSIPNDFGYPIGQFYKSGQKNKNSGIVFTKHVNGEFGIVRVADNIRTELPSVRVEMYSGKNPNSSPQHNWDVVKSQNANAFKSDQAPILVSTKAFGMGIDKPNIRYTIHYGMPSSLESFYQEAGRSGRDRKKSIAYVIFSEFDKDITDQLLDPSKDIEDIRSITKSIPRSSSDDISRSLFFHLKAFSGIDVEIKTIKEVLSQILPLNIALMKYIPFDTDESKFKEKAIFRLLQCGVLSDYEVHYGSKKYGLKIQKFQQDKVIQSVLSYVSASQPGRTKDIESKLSRIPFTNITDYLVEVVRVFITFIYDVIERSRRRSLQESMHAARDVNEEQFRKRLLEYLQEGVGAENIQSLIEKADVEFSDWIIFSQHMANAIEAGEIRGISIRFLESYPDHPGLLLLRGISEAKCSNSDPEIMTQSLASAFLMSYERYSMGIEEIIETIDQLCSEIEVGNLRLLAGGLSSAIYSLLGSNLIQESYAISRLERLGKNDDLSLSIFKQCKIEQSILRASNLISSIEKNYTGVL